MCQSGLSHKLKIRFPGLSDTKFWSASRKMATFCQPDCWVTYLLVFQFTNRLSTSWIVFFRSISFTALLMFPFQAGRVQKTRSGQSHLPNSVEFATTSKIARYDIHGDSGFKAAESQKQKGAGSAQSVTPRTVIGRRTIQVLLFAVCVHTL